MATRHILRAIYGLAIVYTTRWSHPTKDWKYSEINSTKVSVRGLGLAINFNA